MLTRGAYFASSAAAFFAFPFIWARKTVIPWSITSTEPSATTPKKERPTVSALVQPNRSSARLDHSVTMHWASISMNGVAAAVDDSTNPDSAIFRQDHESPLHRRRRPTVWESELLDRRRPCRADPADAASMLRALHPTPKI